MRSDPVPPGTIVVGVDGSPSSEEGVCWAVEQGVLEGRDVTLVHAVEEADCSAPLDHGPIEVLETPPELGRCLLAAAARLANEWMHRVGGDRGRRPRILTALRIGEPREALVELSRDAVLLVLGCRGRAAFAGRPLGSVALGVTDRAACPVIVLRPHRPLLRHGGVLVGTDGTEASGPALEFAFRQAFLRDLRLTVVHSFEDVVSDLHGVGSVRSHEPGYARRRRLLEQAVSVLVTAYPDVRVDLQVARGRAEICLARLSTGADLVVVGTAPLSRFAEAVLGDVSARVIESADTTVAVVPVHAPAVEPLRIPRARIGQADVASSEGAVG